MLSASEKLAIPVNVVVLESDGTEVDGDEELLAFAGSTLLGLKEGEVWQPASVPGQLSMSTSNLVTPTLVEEPLSVSGQSLSGDLSAVSTSTTSTPKPSCSSIRLLFVSIYLL